MISTEDFKSCFGGLPKEPATEVLLLYSSQKNLPFDRVPDLDDFFFKSTSKRTGCSQITFCVPEGLFYLDNIPVLHESVGISCVPSQSRRRGYDFEVDFDVKTKKDIKEYFDDDACHDTWLSGVIVKIDSDKVFFFRFSDIRLRKIEYYQKFYMSWDDRFKNYGGFNYSVELKGWSENKPERIPVEYYSLLRSHSESSWYDERCRGIFIRKLIDAAL